MSYTAVHATEVEAGPGPHPAASPFDKRVGAALGVGAFGQYQVELPARAESMPHNHRDDGAEDVYGFVRGTGSVIVDQSQIALEPGQFVFVTPDSQRHVCAGNDGLTFVAICAAAHS